jgi:hypothetical protein
MRLALVVLFFVVLYFSLRPSPPAEPQRTLSENTTSQQQTGLSGQPLASSERSGPETSTGTTSPPAETADEAVIEQPGVRSGEAERPGEQRTSQRGDAKPGELESAVQKELTRLACLSGRPERGWGSRSRAALRRFVAKAKPKDGNTPSEALLRAMRGYPANYCKPGERTPRKRADATPRSEIVVTPLSPQGEVSPELSYLPPWMVEGGKVTQVEEIAQMEQVAKMEEKVRTDVVAHASPTAELPPSVVRPKRRKQVVRRPRPAIFRSARRFNAPPSLTGWPRSER